MNSMLLQLYLGNKGNCEQIPNTKNFYKFNDKSCEKIEEFTNALPKESLETFNNIMNLEAMIQGETNFANFKEGFKIGLFLGLEMREKQEAED